MQQRPILLFLLLTIFGWSPQVSYAQMQFNEIMYDASGTDTDHEWVEIYNAGTTSVDITGWKFNDGSNHTLNTPPTNGSSGSLNIPQGGYFILAADATQFLQDYPSFTGTVIDTVMSLNNTGDILTLLDKSDTAISTVTYTGATGAAGDGRSLQRESNGGVWGVGVPTPGSQNILSGSTQSDNSQSGALGTASQTSESSKKDETQKNAPPSQISANISMQKTAFTGVAVPVKVVVSGPFKEYLKYGKFLWNMGDGSEVLARDDTPFEYVYDYPGLYTVVFEYYLNPYNTEPDLVIRSSILVSDPGIQIKSIDSSGKIVLLNTATTELNLFGWKLGDASGKLLYVFPRNTFIPPGKEVIFSAKALKLQIPIESLVIVSPLGQIRATYPESKNIVNKIQQRQFPQSALSVEQNIIVRKSATPEPEQESLLKKETLPESFNTRQFSLFVLYFLLLCFAAASVVYLQRLRRQKSTDEIVEI